MKNNEYHISIKFIIFLILSIFVIGCNSSDKGLSEDSKEKKTIELKLSHQWPAPQGEVGDYRSIVAEKFAKSVEEKTNGEVKIQVYPSSSLMKSDQQFEALRKGSLDMALWPVTYDAGKEPLLDIGMLPGLVKNAKQACNWGHSELADKLIELLAKHNTKPLVWVWSGPGGVASKNKAVILPEDANKMKMRAAGKAMEEMFNMVGASITSMPSSEIYSALQTGVLDACATSCESFVSYRLYEQVDYLVAQTDFTYFYLWTPLAISLSTWEILSPEHQKAMLETAEELEPYIYDSLIRGAKNVVDVFTEKGVQVHELTEEEYNAWMKYAEVVWDNFGKNVPGGSELVELAKKVPWE